MQNVVCIINGMLRKMKTDEQNTPLNETLIGSIDLTTDRLEKAPNRVLYVFVEDTKITFGSFPSKYR